MSGEEALVRELTSRDVTGLAAYRIVPREELKSAERARDWFERSGVQGVVALRPVSRETEQTVLGRRLVVGLLPVVLELLPLRLEQRVRRQTFGHLDDDWRRNANI